MIVDRPQFDVASLKPSDVIQYRHKEGEWNTGLLMDASAFTIRVMIYNENTDDFDTNTIHLGDVVDGVVQVINVSAIPHEDIVKTGMNPLIAPEAYLEK